MWAALASFILRQRVAILIGLAVLTGIMAWNATKVTVYFGVPRLLPDDDTTLVAYQNFKKLYDQQGMVIAFGLDENPLESVELFNAWHKLGNELSAIPGVDTVVSLAHLYNLEKDTARKLLTVAPIVKGPVRNKDQLDSIANIIENLPIYAGLIYNDSSNANYLALSLPNHVFDSPDRMETIGPVLEMVKEFSEANNVTIRYSGLPYIRLILTELLREEFKLHIIYAIVITILILFFFFRSFRPVMISMIVVGLGVVWSMGTMGILGYQISILTSIIPPLVIVIGVPNCIYLINKFHQDFRAHGNKIKALSRVVQKVGKATFMTNATTAAGFFTFVFTDSLWMQEFGIVASINILLLFMLSLVLIPITFSYTKPPSERHTKHLEKNWINKVIDLFVHLVENKRKAVYGTAFVMMAIALVGFNMLNTTGNMVDDIPKDHVVIEDLRWFEKNFAGVMPVEISIDTKKTGRAARSSTMSKINELQDTLATYKEFSRPLSLVEGAKFSYQAFHGGDPKYYKLLPRGASDAVFFKKYLENTAKNQDDAYTSVFLADSNRYARVSVSMADIGTIRMNEVFEKLKPQIDSIFPPAKYNVDVTGSSIIFLKGTDYLVKNLFISLGLAVLIIAMIMALLFSSFRMILVSMATNFFPLLITAAMMGFTGIPIKPSTILVFSIAFGISVDDTIHFLAKYRQELKHNNWDIRAAAITALRETGVSMVYTSIILYFGFGVFMLSDFGGTQALGVLVSLTLLIAMVANLVLLPSFLLSLARSATTKAFRDESLLYIYDEEEDIELDDLTIEGQENGTANGSPSENGKGSAKDVTDQSSNAIDG